MRKSALVLVVFVLSSCSSSSPVTGGSGPHQDIEISMQLTVPPGRELHQCQLVLLPNDADVNVVGISHEYTAGSHHFLVFDTDLDAIPAELGGPHDCVRGDEPIMEHTLGILYAAQSPTGSIPFPEGVGFQLNAHRVLMLQTHYINASSQDLVAKASARFDTVPPGNTSIEAGFLIFYDPFIYLPAQGMATSGMRCGVPSDIKILAGSTHYHQRGTGMRVWMDANASSPSTAPFFETHDWEHAPNFVGPLTVAAGSSLRLQCDYVNTDVNEVFQGPNAATSEMCVFASLYYPKIAGDFEDCGDNSFTGTGTHPCSEQLSCVQECPAGDAPQFTRGGVLVGPCWEKCVAMGCQEGPMRSCPSAPASATTARPNAPPARATIAPSRNAVRK